MNNGTGWVRRSGWEGRDDRTVQRKIRVGGGNTSVTAGLRALVLLKVAWIGWVESERHTCSCMPFFSFCVVLCTVFFSLSYSFVSEVSQENRLATRLM